MLKEISATYRLQHFNKLGETNIFFYKSLRDLRWFFIEIY